MASTYALPITANSQSHNHERSHSQYSTYSNSNASNLSPLRDQGHGRHRSEADGNGHLHGAVRSPYAEYNANAYEHNHAHDHSHDRSNSIDSTWTLKPLVNGRAKARPRGEADVGRSPQNKNGSLAKYGFSPVSPIQEAAPAVPAVASS
jgi:zinc transporter 5/7